VFDFAGTRCRARQLFSLFLLFLGGFLLLVDSLHTLACVSVELPSTLLRIEIVLDLLVFGQARRGAGRSSIAVDVCPSSPKLSTASRRASSRLSAW
jgi:hypothetical protein